MMVWLKNTNATVSDVFCAGPSDMKDKRLSDLPIPPGECMSTGTMTSAQLKVKERKKEPCPISTRAHANAYCTKKREV